MEKINKLAKVLRDQGFAKTHDEAVQLAAKFVERGEKTVEEITCPTAEEILKEIEKEERADAQTLLDSVDEELEEGGENRDK